MKKGLLAIVACFIVIGVHAQDNAIVSEYKKTFTTYPFSDPNPIPINTNIYPYFRYDGFTDKSIHKEWKVVELENKYLKLMILPEIGGKIWSAIEKSTGRSFIYYNHVVKFRDIAMRGPWTSGGIEPNYGIIGHTPNSVTPVDYLVRKNENGSVSCIISVLDLLTSTYWTMEINLPKDKAYFTTKSFWYNSNTMEEPYYHWMNTGIKVKGDLQYMYPGNHFLGHQGEYGDWPINKQNGKDVSFYNNNDFGGYKSYHVFGKYTDFFGAYWHDDDFGMARYSGHEDKAGKKIWIWGLSQQGMIWEKELTDTDGQYSEIQSGRLFNQSSPKSTFTPFKHKSFVPDATDTWTEYWYPVLKTKGFVEANEYGALNVKYDNGQLKLYFNPVLQIKDTLEVKQGDNIIYDKVVVLSPLHTFTDSIKMDLAQGDVIVSLGRDKLVYQSNPNAYDLSRPLDTPKDFNWDSVYGLYTQGAEYIDQKMYPEATLKLQAALQKDPGYLPALVKLAELQYHNLQYLDALQTVKKALSIYTYDGAANYYYGVINTQLGHTIDAKDGFDIASLSMDYKSAAYNGLSDIYLKEKNFDEALTFAGRALDYNRFDISALQNEAISYRYQQNKTAADKVLDTILSFDPLNHFARFEKYLLHPSESAKNDFTSMIRDEQPIETYLQLAEGYYKTGYINECEQVLKLSPENALIDYWLAFLQYKAGRSFSNYLGKANNMSPAFVFPYRAGDEDVLLWAKQQNNSWQPKYYLAILYRDRNRLAESKKLFNACSDEPQFAPFYAARAATIGGVAALTDLKKAVSLDKNEWRYTKLLSEYYIDNNQPALALQTIEPFYHTHQDNYIIGMLYAKSLLLNERYAECGKLLSTLNILPFEGATVGRELYREAELMQAISNMKAKKYTSALTFIEKAKQWPENLGVGKPYADRLDDRLEDWLSYVRYQQIGNNINAGNNLKAIIAFKPQIENTVSDFIPANTLVSAWAIQKLQGKPAATSWLNQQVKQYPDEKIVIWSRQVFENKAAKADNNDAGVRLLVRIMQSWRK